MEHDEQGNGGSEPRAFESEAELRRTIDQMQRKVRLMETIINSLGDGVVAASKEGELILANPASQQLVGMGMTDAPAERWAQTYGTFHPDEATPYPSERLPLVRAMQGEEVNDERLFIRNAQRPKGVHIGVSGRPLCDAESRLQGGVIILRDISEMKDMDTKLRGTIVELQEQTQLMETIFNSISDGVVVADDRGRFTLFNPSAERMVGMGMIAGGPEQWTDSYGIFHLDQVTPMAAEELPLVRAIGGMATDEKEMFIRNENKPEGIFISVSGRPLLCDQGAIRGGVIVFREVTERIRAEEALSQAFDQGRLEVVDTILHNIGNAINSVSVGVETIRERVVKNHLLARLSSVTAALEEHRDDDWLEYLRSDSKGQQVLPFIVALASDFAAQNERLQETVERVMGRVSHIVDIIRTQRLFDYESMARKYIDLPQSIAVAVKVLEESLVRGGIDLRIDCRRAPQEIRIAESRFHQMLVNLIKNGIEAIMSMQRTSGLAEPRIGIEAYENGESLMVDVIDNGIGISAEWTRRIFTAGYTSKEHGSGLGLPSAANFVIGSGGSICALSDGPGTGATIRVELRHVLIPATPRGT